MTLVSIPDRDGRLRQVDDPNVCAVCRQWCGLKCERPFEWNRRYVAYCVLLHGSQDPHAVLAADTERYRGGKMTGFIVWCNEAIGLWRSQTGRYSGPLDHAAFDAWLAEWELHGRICLDRAKREERS